MQSRRFMGLYRRLLRSSYCYRGVLRHETCRTGCAVFTPLRSLSQATPPAGAATSNSATVPPGVVTAPGAGSSQDELPPIHPILITGLREALSRLVRANEWLAITDVYSDLPPNVRRTYVRPHKALVHVLRRLESTLDIVVSPSGLYCGRGATLPADPAVPTTTPRGQNTTPSSSSSSSDGAKSGGAATPSTPVMTTAPTPAPSAPTTSAAAAAAPVVPPPVDFYYDVELPLSQVPPPPPDFDVTPSSLLSPTATDDGAVMALSTFVAYIPSFFVPLHEVLAEMPGYTEEHVNRYLHLKATEMVTVGGQRYIRLHGGYRQVSLTGNELAESRFARYRPLLEWLPAFVDAFGESCGEWIPLPVLLSRVPPEVLAQLPWGSPETPPIQRAETIFFFAQMQHVFAFSFDAEGRGAVLRRPPGYGGLDVATSPTPRSVNEVLGIVPVEGIVDIAHLQAQLTSAAVAEMEAYYGGLVPFLAAHKPIFYRPDDTEAVVVMRTRYHTRMYTASLPLEKQLELALANRQKQKIRSLRRQLTFRDNPAHPFHDPDNLAQEVSKYVPRRGFVQLKVFIKAHVPEDLHGFLPRKLHNFFANYPQYFQQFEYQKAGMWCISRPGQPLPRGVIRSTFSEGDLLALCAEYLQERGNGRSCSALYLNLPRPAQDMIRKHYGGMFYFLQKHPRFFRLVLSSEGENAASTAVVHLVDVPTSADVGDASQTEDSQGTDPDGGADDLDAESEEEEGEEEEEEGNDGGSERQKR